MTYDPINDPNRPRPVSEEPARKVPGAMPTRRPATGIPVIAILGAGLAVVLFVWVVASMLDNDDARTVADQPATTTTTPDDTTTGAVPKASPDNGTSTTDPATDPATPDTGTGTPDNATPGTTGQDGTTGTDGATQPNTTP